MPVIIKREKPELRRLYALVIANGRRILMSNLTAELLRVLHQSEGKCSTFDLANRCNANKNTVTKCLQRLRSTGLVKSTREGSMEAYHELICPVEIHTDLEVAY